MKIPIYAAARKDERGFTSVLLHGNSASMLTNGFTMESFTHNRHTAEYAVTQNTGFQIVEGSMEFPDHWFEEKE